jgi:hypothetical protein
MPPVRHGHVHHDAPDGWRSLPPSNAMMLRAQKMSLTTLALAASFELTHSDNVFCATAAAQSRRSENLHSADLTFPVA